MPIAVSGYELVLGIFHGYPRFLEFEDHIFY
jgi:hypothetical protein